MFRKALIFTSTLIILVCTQVQSAAAAEVNTEPLKKMERRTFDLVNQHRRSIGEEDLVWNKHIVRIARKHSERMADGDTSFGHDGFSHRVEKIQVHIPTLRSAGENVAYTTYHPGTARSAVEGWLNSQGHRENIEGNYKVSAMGIAKIGRYYYFTQIFVNR